MQKLRKGDALILESSLCEICVKQPGDVGLALGRFLLETASRFRFLGFEPRVFQGSWISGGDGRCSLGRAALP